MCSGSSLYLFLIFPCGMWCLSAARIVFVSILLAVCKLGGICMLVRVCSISCSNSVQSAFL